MFQASASGTPNQWASPDTNPMYTSSSSTIPPRYPAPQPMPETRPIVAGVEICTRIELTCTSANSNATVPRAIRLTPSHSMPGSGATRTHAAVAAITTAVVRPSQSRRRPVPSARRPIAGAVRATTTPAAALAADSHAVPRSSGPKASEAR